MKRSNDRSVGEPGHHRLGAPFPRLSLPLLYQRATALSPADTMPLTRVGKSLMMIEALLSITVVVLLAGRAVNILGS